MDRTKLVVVAGGGGFIGSHLVAELLRRGHERVRAVDVKPIDDWHLRSERADSVVADLRDLNACRAAVDGASYVYNLAADMGGMGFIEHHKAECMLNVLLSTHMLVAARDAGVERFFFSSTACVYNTDLQRQPEVTALRETEDVYPANPEDGYGWEKLFSERMARHFREDYGIATRVARYHLIYGPNGTWDGGREKAPAAICRKVAEAKLSGRHEIEIWGDGQQTRSMLFVDDCVEGTIRVMEGDHVDPLNVGSDRLIRIDDLVSIVECIAGVHLRRRYDLDAPKGVRGRNSDNTLIKATLGWEPRVSLEDGLAATYAWIYDQVAARHADRRFGLDRPGPAPVRRTLAAGVRA
jgi:GDP-D-mannose 3',5'-epimerase